MVMMTMGNVGWVMYAIAIIILCFANMFACVIVGGGRVADWLRLIPGVKIAANGWLYKAVIFGYAILCPVAFAFPRNLGFLSVFSSISILCVFLYVGSMYYEAGVHLSHEGISPTVKHSAFNSGIFTSFSLFMAAFSMVAFILPVLSATKTVTKKKIILVTAGYGCLFTSCISTGILGYLMFGKDVKANILDSLPHDTLVLIVGFSLFFVIGATYPVIEISVKTLFAFGIFHVMDANELSTRKRLFVIGCSNVIPVLLAVFVPNIKPAMAIGGASGGAITTFIFPPLIWLFASQDKWSTGKMYCAY
jgi:hypothetical protein